MTLLKKLRLPRLAAAFALGSITLAAPCSAALEADFVTSRGTVTVLLEHAKAPKAVASLMTLSQGMRSWYEPGDGSVRREPFYQGLSFDAVVNTPSMKLAEVGVADAGYQFQDEIDASLVHEPYVLSMSNNGPNTNGGRLAFTGSVALPGRNGLHTVLGKIPAGPGRTVLDNILAAGANATTVTGVVIRRTDAAAVAFDEHAVPLPWVEAVNGPLQVIPGGAVNLLFQQPTVSVLRASTSPDLAAWQPRFHRFSALDDAPAGATATLDSALLPKQFYQISVALYPAVPQAGGPSNLANRKLTLLSAGSGELVYQFDATGLAGTYTNVPFPSDPGFSFSGDFDVVSQGGDEPSPVFGPHAFQILIHNEGLGGTSFNLIRGGIDAVNASNVTGRHRMSLRQASSPPGFDEGGTLVLTRP